MNKRLVVFSSMPQRFCGYDDNGDRDGEAQNKFPRSWALPGRAGYACDHERVPWWHYEWDFVAETHYSYKSPSALAEDCSFLRGGGVDLSGPAGSDRFKLTSINHFLGPPPPSCATPRPARPASHAGC